MPHPVNGYEIDGVKVPGVTTITGRFGDKSGLIVWGWKRGKEFPNEPLYATRDKAGELGTIVHDMFEQYIKGEETFVDTFGLCEEDTSAVMSAYEAATEWFESGQFKVVAQEEQLVSRTYRFGGTFDAIAYDNKGRLCMLDWKTSDGIWPEMLIQVGGAYRILWNENHPDMPLTGGTHLCRFAKQNGDFAHHYFPDLKDAERAFILERELYDIDMRLKKRC